MIEYRIEYCLRKRFYMDLNVDVNENKKYIYLDRVNSPDDLKAMDQKELCGLAGDIRAFLVDKVSENGGHLASNLGVVELTMALHRVFSTPKDHIIFDVGHQSYVHKILTGRKGEFDTLRCEGGLCGFESRRESEHDCFGTGHSSTSISAALGFATADKLSGSDAYTVAVVGDGAFTGGMIHEALNNCENDLKLIIVINENEMSISKNTGRFARTLSFLRMKKGYVSTKSATKKVLEHIPLVGKIILSLLRGIRKLIKGAVYGNNYFEDLGLHYIGRIDGHDEKKLEEALRTAVEFGESVVLHIKTKKGMGYEPAESLPGTYHSIPPAAHTAAESTFSSEFGKALCDMARDDEKICAITAAMADGTGLCDFRDTFPDRFFDVGIAEEHAVTFAAGLSANGHRPCVAVYSTFLQRAYDNIIHDVALQGLDSVFCIDRAGLNARDGATHHGIFDVSFLSSIPGVKIYSPITYASLHEAMKRAFEGGGVSAIRYPSGTENVKVRDRFFSDEGDPLAVKSDFGTENKEELDAIIITYGRIVSEAMSAADKLKSDGKKVGIVLVSELSPYGELADTLTKFIPEKPSKVVLLEEGVFGGGAAMRISCELQKRDVMKNKSVKILAIKDDFVIPASADETVYSVAKISSNDIIDAISE